MCVWRGGAGLKQEANGGHVRGHSNVLLSNLIPSESMHTHTHTLLSQSIFEAIIYLGQCLGSYK